MELQQEVIDCEKFKFDLFIFSALFQRGIRLTKTNPEIWTQYFQFELEYLQKIKERLDFLGVNTKTEEEQKSLIELETEKDGNEMESRQDVDEPNNAKTDSLPKIDFSIPRAIFTNAIKGIWQSLEN